MNPIKKELKWWANKLFFRSYRYKRIERRHLLPQYSADAAPSASKGKMVVVMYDGKCNHGGLADRLRGAIYFYALCRETDRRFRLNFIFPFKLETYLIPNTYDWRLKPGELTFNISEARPVFTDTIGITGPREIKWEKIMHPRNLEATQSSCMSIAHSSARMKISADISMIFSVRHHFLRMP